MAFCVAYYDSVVEHGDRQQLGMDIAEAMERADGADYEKVIRLHQRMRYYTDDDRAFKIAVTIIDACDAERPPCVATPKQTRAAAVADIDRLGNMASDAELRSRVNDYVARSHAPAKR